MFFKRKIDFSKDNLESIIEACLLNDQLAQRALFKMFYSFGKSVTIRFASNGQEAEEILNDSFLKMYKNLHKFEPSRPFKAWFKTIIINTSIDYYRKSTSQKNAHHIVDVDSIEIADTNYDVVSKISTNELIRLVQQLTPAYRLVFTLFIIEGYSHREIAEMLGIKEGTSKSNLNDARIKMQLLIKNIYPHLHTAYALKFTKINEN
jgi:RNA polymerase sigma-70 factor (ECF subfamily)